MSFKVGDFRKPDSPPPGFTVVWNGTHAGESQAYNFGAEVSAEARKAIEYARSTGAEIKKGDIAFMNLVEDGNNWRAPTKDENMAFPSPIEQVWAPVDSYTSNANGQLFIGWDVHDLTAAIARKI